MALLGKSKSWQHFTSLHEKKMFHKILISRNSLFQIYYLFHKATQSNSAGRRGLIPNNHFLLSSSGTCHLYYSFKTYSRTYYRIGTKLSIGHIHSDRKNKCDFCFYGAYSLLREYNYKILIKLQLGNYLGNFPVRKML